MSHPPSESERIPAWFRKSPSYKRRQDKNRRELPTVADESRAARHALLSGRRTFFGIGIVSVAAAAFIGWQSVRPDHPERRFAGESVDRVPEATSSQIDSAADPVTESLSPATTTIVPAVSGAESPAVSTDTPSSVSVDRSRLDDESQLALGKELFVHEWQPGDQLAGSGDGLGPVYNGRSCAECHSQGGLGGAGSNEHSVHAYEILPAKAGEAVRSGVIHTFATSVGLQEDLATLDNHFRPGKVVAGLGRPGSKELTSKRDIDATRLVWINSPALWGLGKIDRLTSSQLKQAVNITAGAENRQTARGVQGRFRLHDDGSIGKFGWKGQFASLKDFVAGACANELGLSNEYARQSVPREFRPDSEARHDLNTDQVESLVKFVAALPEPKQVMPDDPTHRALVKNGEAIMSQVGCTICHTRDVGDAKNVYGDYRLHKVEDSLGPSNAYYIQNFKLEYEPPYAYPTLDEWRTPALWGVADTAPYWHDGSAKTLEAAILRHAREAKPVIDAYRRLPREDQESVLAFLKTLRGPAASISPEAIVALDTTE